MKNLFKSIHRRSWRAEKERELARETRFRPFQDHRRSPRSTRIATKNEHRRSWRAGSYENSQTKPAPDHRNSDEFRPPSVRHLDLATRPFTSTVRTPSVNRTVWGKILKIIGRSRNLVFSLELQLISSLGHCKTEHTEKKAADASCLCNKFPPKWLRQLTQPRFWLTRGLDMTQLILLSWHESWLN